MMDIDFAFCLKVLAGCAALVLLAPCVFWAANWLGWAWVQYFLWIGDITGIDALWQ